MVLELQEEHMKGILERKTKLKQYKMVFARYARNLREVTPFFQVAPFFPSVITISSTDLFPVSELNVLQ